LMDEMEAHLPLRSMVLFSGGQISEEVLQDLIDQVNANIDKAVS